MIGRPDFTVEPWGITATGLPPSILPQSESIFALSNGFVGWRGNLEEGEPHGIPGSYLNGFFETFPLPQAEPGYGLPDQGEALVNTVNGKLLRLFVDDEPFDIEQGTRHSHRRRLDFRTGILSREAEWTSPSGRRVRVTSERLVSLVERPIAAIAYEVEAVGEGMRVTIQSELLANEPIPSRHPDSRVAARLERSLVPLAQHLSHDRSILLHRTTASGLTTATGMEHVLLGPDRTSVATEVAPDLARTTFSVELEAGERLRIVKFVAYGWSASHSPASLRDEADAALGAAVRSGWHDLVARQRAVLDEFWACADVEVDGDAELQQAVRFALFQVFQAAHRAEGNAIPGKALTGSGYDGHAFWDTEIYVLPLLMYTAPGAAADALRWRHRTLGEARRRAQELRLAGAAFAWRTIGGGESSGYWPASTAAFHVNADVADAVVRYVRATGDRRFEEEVGIELLVETARLWMALGQTDEDGGFHLDGVTGPDEYTAVVDDNVYTNLAAQQNLRAAADAAERHPKRASALGVTAGEVADWRRAAQAMAIPYDEERRVHAQSRGFTDHERWDFEGMEPGDYPLMEHFPYFELYRKQVVKQADLVLAMQLHPDAFTDEEKLRNFTYYEALTVRDSSLSAASQSVLAAEVGELDLASDYLAEAALVDLDNIHESARDGLHLAALAGVWTALVAGFGGLRHTDDGLRFAPRLPDGLRRLCFRLRLGDATVLRVTADGEAVEYALESGDQLSLRHFGEEVTVTPSEPVRLPIPPRTAPTVRARQPKWRAPRTVVRSNGD